MAYPEGKPSIDVPLDTGCLRTAFREAYEKHVGQYMQGGAQAGSRMARRLWRRAHLRRGYDFWR